MSPVIRIRCRGFVPSTGAPDVSGVVLGVQGDRIAYVNTTPGDEAVDYDFPTGTILPGLVDAHCHLTLTGDRRTYEEMTADSDEMMALTAVKNAAAHLRSGVTTIRDNGGRNRVPFIVREAQARGYFDGPRMLLAGRPITHSFGHFYWCNGTADGETEIRAAVRKLVAEGADHIKIMASGGGTAGNIPFYASYTTAELRVAVEAAHALGRLTTAHCRASESIDNAVAAGLDCIEHAEFLVPGEMTTYGSGVAASGDMRYDPRVAQRLIESGVYISFTAQAGGYHSLVDLRAAEKEGVVRNALERQLEMKLSLLSSLMDDGALPRLAISTDAGPFDVPFGRLQDGLELAVQAGMSPLEAIESATRVAAEACGISSLVGTLEPGKIADLLVVEGDPTSDITALNAVTAVFLSGKRVA